MGNTLYRQGKMKEALECYKKAVDYINETVSASTELDALKKMPNITMSMLKRR